MNGRAYDYNLGRFLSVDPFIQAPGNSQSMNPYSYGMNNPLAGTDPSGYIFFLAPVIGKGIAWGLTAWGAVETAKATGETIAKVELGEIEASDAAIELAKTAGQEMVLRKADVALDVAKAAVKKFDTPNTPKVENGKNTSQNTQANNEASKPETIGDQSKNRNTQNNQQQNNSENTEERTYHRLGDSSENVQSIKESGELRGNPATNTYASDIPKVKAYDGPLPEGKKGFEFKTPAKPDAGGKPGQPTWSGDGHNPDVKTVNGQAVIKCTVTKDNSC